MEMLLSISSTGVSRNISSPFDRRAHFPVLREKTGPTIKLCQNEYNKMPCLKSLFKQIPGSLKYIQNNNIHS